MKVQWSLHITDIFGTNFIVRCREVSAVRGDIFCKIIFGYMYVVRRCPMYRCVC